ncbi:penicillin-binding transpeptidase domain-containing protein [Amycolatopsis pigmentata]|uniref:Penicillin-binding transpeptidase domain-containing protein n=1 Tax=Amycolatopsis pigmentata TaxID=450801 RepID=A0ABW5G5G6_9PSEU
MTWRRWVLVGGALVVVGILVVAVVVLKSGSPDGTADTAASREQADVVARYLSAWSHADVKTASALTDDPPNAAEGLLKARTELGVDPAATVVKTAGKTANFRVSWTFAPGTVWTYDNSLSLVQAQGKWVVRWAPSVIHPQLFGGAVLRVLGHSGNAVLDRDGKPLLAWQADQPQAVDGNFAPILTPGLGRVATEKAAASKTVVIRIGEDDKVLFGRPAGPPLTSTLSSRVQAEAQTAVDGASFPAMLVAIQPSTGDILAVAQNAAAGPAPNALTGGYAPGSTFKMATATAVLERNAASSDTVLPCPGSVQIGQRNIPNDDNFSLPPLPLHSAFAHSCNTTFAQLASGLPADALVDAANQLGINADFTIPGIATEAGKVVAPANSAEQVEAAIGQGKVQTSPFGLTLAAATVAAGKAITPRLWHGLDTTINTPYQAPPDAVVGQLRSMMREVVTDGTATGLAGSGNVAGKTGTAQFGDGTQANGWFTGYRDDLAFSVLLLGSNSSKPAVSVAAAFLR